MSEFSSLRQQAGLSVSEVAVRLGYSERTVYRWENDHVSPKRAVLDLLRSWRPADNAPNRTSAFTFIDLFAGIGGLRRGFQTIGGECIFTSEWDRFSQQTYRANFSEDTHEIAGDIRAVGLQEIPSHDVLLAGFPCQPFSIAGVSKKNALNRPHGFACETQGTLFYDVKRIIDHHRPHMFVLENVKNLVNHDKGRTFKIINDVLTKDLRYHIKWKVIDAKPWVPQHRERIFIVGFRDIEDFTFDGMTIPGSLSGPKLGSILHSEDGTEKPDNGYTSGRHATVSDKYTLSQHLWTYLRNYAEKHREKGNGFGFGLVGPDDITRTLSARYYKDGSEILIKQPRKPPRRLTPRECARLMGFDKPSESSFKIPVSDTQAYKQFGNSVVVPVVQAVAAHVLPYLLRQLATKSELLQPVTQAKELKVANG
ncbi:cytosine-specific methyltransferase [Terrihabitans soli]|uniref:Cytosine-specific methyltransferase n=1 Tax=Terrihabitans soli TaxID=708113 RepID=A0A6S6QU79_9HYPH|nr:DNA (cytosine-5-)-methyltransferase [Terrihabitans soli]BCJ90510.1 cytosine-specific methyltransferase [Terrihabitans soli]